MLLLLKEFEFWLILGLKRVEIPAPNFWFNSWAKTREDPPRGELLILGLRRVEIPGPDFFGLTLWLKIEKILLAEKFSG